MEHILQEKLLMGEIKRKNSPTPNPKNPKKNPKKGGGQGGNRVKKRNWFSKGGVMCFKKKPWHIKKLKVWNWGDKRKTRGGGWERRSSDEHTKKKKAKTQEKRTRGKVKKKKKPEPLQAGDIITSRWGPTVWKPTRRKRQEVKTEGGFPGQKPRRERIKRRVTLKKICRFVTCGGGLELGRKI